MTLGVLGARGASAGYAAQPRGGLSWSAAAGGQGGGHAGHAGHGGGSSGGSVGHGGGSYGGSVGDGGSYGGQGGGASGGSWNGSIRDAGQIPGLPAGWSTWGWGQQQQGGHAQHAAGPQPGDEQAAGLGGMVSRLLPPGNVIGRLLGVPLGAFSYLVGHDSALRAAQNGDVGGWLVNTQDHGAHTHTLGGNAGGRAAPLGFLGTLGQEAGYLLGLDGVFGNSAAYDRVYGTNYGHDAGEPTHILPIWGQGGGIANLGGGQASAHAGH